MKQCLLLVLLILGIKTQGQQVICHAYADPSHGCEELNVDFSDSSTGNPTSFYWNFGNGESSTIADPVYYYCCVGKYNVMHVVSNAVSSDTCYLTIMIGNYPPQPSLTSNVPDGIVLCNYDTVIFTAYPDTFDTYIFSDLWGAQQSSSSPNWVTEAWAGISVQVQPVENGCRGFWLSDPAISISFYFAPFIQLVSNVLDACQGDTVIISAAVLNSSQADNITFMVNSVVKQSGASDTFICTSIQPNDTITAIGSNNGCVGTISNGVIINITDLPTITISGPAGVCHSDTAYFNAVATLGGDQPVYQWSVNGNPVGNNSPYFQSADLNENDTIRCLLTSNARCANPAVVISPDYILTVYPLPATPSITVSEDTLMSSPGLFYRWYFNDTAIYNANLQEYFANRDGNYSVVVGDGNKCLNQSAQVPVSVVCGAYFVIYADPENPNIYFGENESTGANLSYSWTFGYNHQYTQSNPVDTFKAKASGDPDDDFEYLVCLTVAGDGGCTSTYCDYAVENNFNYGTDVITFLGPTSILSLTGDNIPMLRLLPNPATNYLMIDYNFTNWSTSGEVSLEILNELGQIVYTQPILQSSGFQRIEIAKFSAGIYTTFIRGNEQMLAAQKFAKE